MKYRTNKNRFWSEIALGVITVVLAIFFIVEIADIYYSGGEVIFDRLIVTQRLKILLAPIIIWIVGIIACFVLSIVYPDKTFPKTHTNLDKVKKLRLRIPDGSGEEFFAERKKYTHLEIGRIVMYGIATAFSLAVAVITLCYISDVTHFRSGEFNHDILNLVRKVVPWISASFILFVLTAVYEYATAKKELKIISKMLVLGKGKPIYTYPAFDRLNKAVTSVAKQEDKITWIVRGIILAVAVTFIGLGINNGGTQDALYKAVNICTECIGLG